MRSIVACLLLLAACRTPRAEPQSAPEAVSTNVSKPSTEPPTAGTNAKVDPTDEAFIVRPSGIRCMAAPCPYFLVSPEAKQDLEPLQIHELKWDRTGASEAQATRWVQQVNTTELRVRGKVERRVKAGPAGDAMVLNVVSVDR
ncbi:MAG: DUF6748 domain-containing protein [Myxococcaceae bacterium]